MKKLSLPQALTLHPSRRLQIVFPVAMLLTLLIASCLFLLSSGKTRYSSEATVKVQVMTAERMNMETAIKTSGMVALPERAEIAVETSGLITHVSSKLIQGGVLLKNEILLRLDEHEHLLNLQRASANVARAQMELAGIERIVMTEYHDWNKFQTRKYFEPDPLVLYEPQLNNARNKLADALAIDKMARVNLDRTTVRSPYASRVMSVHAVKGSRVSQGTIVAVLAGIEKAVIIAPVPHESINWIDIGPQENKTQGSQVSININGQTGHLSRTGTVSGTLGEIDPETGTIDVIITLTDPYGVLSESPDILKIPFGAEVYLEITGKTFNNIVSIPESALQGGSKVWIAGRDDRLEIMEVQVEAVKQGRAMISSGLKPGQRIILTEIAEAVQGMKLEVIQE